MQGVGWLLWKKPLKQYHVDTLSTLQFMHSYWHDKQICYHVSRLIHPLSNNSRSLCVDHYTTIDVVCEILLLWLLESLCSGCFSNALIQCNYLILKIRKWHMLYVLEFQMEWALFFSHQTLLGPILCIIYILPQCHTWPAVRNAWNGCYLSFIVNWYFFPSLSLFPVSSSMLIPCS